MIFLWIKKYINENENLGKFFYVNKKYRKKTQILTHINKMINQNWNKKKKTINEDKKSSFVT